MLYPHRGLCRPRLALSHDESESLPDSSLSSSKICRKSVQELVLVRVCKESAIRSEWGEREDGTRLAPGGKVCQGGILVVGVFNVA